jgi:ABC-type polysaccharide/polyol phosphate transport system ATPase subunit
MAARLGFASAIHTNPDILLIDEVLAVGDMRFRVKCYRKLAKLREQGTSFVLVSHDPNTIYLYVIGSLPFKGEGNCNWRYRVNHEKI